MRGSTWCCCWVPLTLIVTRLFTWPPENGVRVVFQVNEEEYSADTPGCQSRFVGRHRLQSEPCGLRRGSSFGILGSDEDNPKASSVTMKPLASYLTLCLCFLASPFVARAQNAEQLPGTQPLTLQGDLSDQMVAGIDTFLLREIERSVSERQTFWKRDFASAEAYEKSVGSHRQRLRKIVGATDPRVPVAALEFVGSTGQSIKIAETDQFTVQAVRWPVLEGVFGEGLWLEPKTPTIACVIAIPDADQTPELLTGLTPGLVPERQFARRL